MLAPRFRLRAASEIAPLRQGDFSNLCGLYSVLNAIQLALWPLKPSRAELRTLHREGVRYLSRKRKLSSVLTSGMDDHIWVELADTLVAYVNVMFGGTLMLQPLFPRSDDDKAAISVARAIGIVRRTLISGQPILCGLGGALNHFTVLAGYSRARLMLFDSSRFSWIEQRNVGITQAADKRHWLYGARAVVDEW